MSQFTTRVISGFAVRYPIMFSVNHAAIFVWIFSPWFPWFSSLALPSLLESTPLSYCSASTTSWNVATRPLSVFSLYRRFRRFDFKPWPTAAAQIVALQLRAFWHDSLLPVEPTFTIDYSTSYLRATHCPVIAHRRSQHRHHPHHRPSCILRAPHPSETHACRSPTTPSRSLPPSALQPRLHGASHHFKRLRASSPRRAPFTPPTRSSSSASSPARERPFHRFSRTVHINVLR